MTATVTYLSLMNVFDDIQVVLGNPDGISEKKQTNAWLFDLLCTTNEKIFLSHKFCRTKLITNYF